jgi:cobalt/nickel transport system permease protein
VAGIAGSTERAIFTEEHARRAGWLQGLDPRAKLVMFLVAVLTAGFLTNLAVLAGLYAVVLVAARASRTPFDFFIRRVWTGIPFFAGVVIVPSLFLGGPPHLFSLRLGPVTLALSVPAIWSALVFVMRVGVSVSLAVLLVMTTRWADLLKSLHALRVPQVFVLILSMTYRYVFLFLHAVNGMLEARRSRIVGVTSGGEQRRWIAGSIGCLMNRSFHLSSDVHSAMLARGFTGEVRTYHRFAMRAADWIAVGGCAVVAAAALAAGMLLR